MRVVVTGGGGFIGANLVRRLIAKGADVTVIDDFSTGYRTNLEGLAIEVVEGSILDREALAPIREAEAVVHLAAVPSVPRSVKDPITSHHANATGSLYVLETARQARSHVVVASSSSIYGANAVLPKVETMCPMPISPYAVSKLAAESYAAAFQRCYELPTLSFRFFNVFGPLQSPGHAYAAVVPAFTHAAVTGSTLRVHGDGRQTRDFTFVGTVVDTLCDALERRVTSLSPVNLAFGTRHSLLEVLEIIRFQTGAPIDVEHVDEREGDVRDSQADSTLLRQLFPQVEPVPLEEGLKQTIQWMRSREGARVR
jgi:UDP-glucose 4-epimerase